MTKERTSKTYSVLPELAFEDRDESSSSRMRIVPPLIKQHRPRLASLTIRTTTSPDTLKVHVTPQPSLELVDVKNAAIFEKLVLNSSVGLTNGLAPIPIEGCTGGAYYLRSPSCGISTVFKPSDEEAYAVNNPKAHVGTVGNRRGIKHGIPNGSAALRECAAYLLDHASHALGLSAHVPKTTMVRAYHPSFHVADGQASAPGTPKLGSLQEYVKHDCSADDFGPNRFASEAVHRIAILDIRLCNQDRHGGNILVQCSATTSHYGRTRAYSSSPVHAASPVCPQASMSKWRHGETITIALLDAQDSTPHHNVGLIPIDHGCTLPHYRYMDETTFIWMGWAQATEPFTAAELDAIAKLDSFQDSRMLTHELEGTLEPAELLSLHIGTLVLQVCAADGLTLSQIGAIMVRECDDHRSILEGLIDATHETLSGHQVQAPHETPHEAATFATEMRQIGPLKESMITPEIFMTAFHSLLMTQLPQIKTAVTKTRLHSRRHTFVT